MFSHLRHIECKHLYVRREGVNEKSVERPKKKKMVDSLCIALTSTYAGRGGTAENKTRGPGYSQPGTQDGTRTQGPGLFSAVGGRGGNTHYTRNKRYHPFHYILFSATLFFTAFCPFNSNSFWIRFAVITFIFIFSRHRYITEIHTTLHLGGTSFACCALKVCLEASPCQWPARKLKYV